MQARGLRNNNPLNIRRDGQAWQGLCAVQTDRSFCQFRSMEYGFRAGFVTLHTYMTKHGLRTIAQIIRRWAPPCENNTEAYVSTVSRVANIGRDVKLDWHNKGAMLSVVRAMAYVENGVMVSAEGSLAEGYEMARKSIELRTKKR